MAVRDRLLSNALHDLTKREAIWHGSLLHGLKQICTDCADLLNVQRVCIWDLSEDLMSMNAKVVYRATERRFEYSYSLNTHAFPRYFSALFRQRVVDINHVSSDPRSSELVATYLKPLRIGSLLDATISYEGKIHGVLSLAQVGSHRIWTQAEINFVTSVADFVAQLIMVKTMREHDIRYKALFEGTGDAIFVLVNGVFKDCNPAALQMFRCTREALIGLSPEACSPSYQPDGTRSDRLAMKKVTQALDGNAQHFKWRHLRLDNTEFDAEVTLTAANIEGEFCLIGVVRDVSEQTKAQAQILKSRLQLEQLAYHDSLTGLPNREGFHRQMLHYLGQAQQGGYSLAVLLLDLNRFKEVNNTLGHSLGDTLLQHISEVIKAALMTQAVNLYRLGGDEFAVLLPKIESVQVALTTAEALINCLSVPLHIAGMNLELGGSVGIAVYPQHGENSHSLLRCADVAMYHAKNQGSGLSIYDSGYDSHSKRRLTLVAELGIAIREDQLFLEFQPRVNILSGQCVGCEALVRWLHPEHGLIPPGDFIPVAELSNIIQPLTEWVVRRALEQAREWQEKDINLTMSVNLSARNLINMRCAESISALLSETGMLASRLEVEITESAFIVDPQRALDVVDELQRQGVSLAIDDFGTGYSSMSYLKRLPVATLKIDRSFVKDLLSDEADAVIVRSTVNLAHSFGLQAVAEGVEDQATLDKLKQFGCDQAQGFFLARPLSAADFVAWWHRHSQLASSY